jgi:hypothetical protein
VRTEGLVFVLLGLEADYDAERVESPHYVVAEAEDAIEPFHLWECEQL